MSKVVVITGGGNGFGYELVKKFLNEGWQVITSFHSDEGKENLNSIATMALKYTFMDLEHNRSIKEFIAFISKNSEKVDCLINNAATANYIGPILSIPIENWEKVLKVNFLAQHKIIFSLFKIKYLSEGASIINITSRAATKAFNLLGPYGVSKGALEVYTKYLANELREKGIRANSVGISADTNLYRKHALEKANYGYTKTLERIGKEYMPQASHSINPVFFLASNESKYITGEHIEATTMEIPLN